MSTAATLRPTAIHSNPINAASTQRRNTTRPVYAAPSRKTMSLTQTYYLAHKARAKLSREAAQPDHDLRLLVGHANMLDSLMVELAEAERQQESWFNQSARSSAPPTTTAKKAAEKRHIQWADRIVEEAVAEDEYEEDSDSDSDFDYEEEDEEMTAAARAATTATVTVEEVDEEDEVDDDEEDYAQLELVRTPSHTSGSPPELLADHLDSDSSDDESMPPSPAEAALPLPPAATKDRRQQAYGEEEYYTGRRSATGLVSAIMVY